MTVSEEQWSALLEVLHEAGLGLLLGRKREYVLQRLEAFDQDYSRRVSTLPKHLLAPRASVRELLDEEKKNPHRVRSLFQALAFGCTPPILSMLWMVLQGSTIESLQFSHIRGETSRLVVELLLPDRETPQHFASDEHWDAAVLRLAGLSKRDNQPVIESFYALYIPQPDGHSKLVDRWVLRVLEWMSTFGSGIFCPSNIDPEHVYEVAGAIVEAVAHGWLDPTGSKILGEVRRDPTAAANAVSVLAQDYATTAKITDKGRRTLRQARFYRQLTPASNESLEKVRIELERVLASAPGEYEQADIEELEDQLNVVESLLSTKSS